MARWFRPDGYIFEIRVVDARGKIDAVFFVKLRAPNYPGSTYTLAYDQARDQLRGVYFQALQQQRFNVSFMRMK